MIRVCVVSASANRENTQAKDITGAKNMASEPVSRRGEGENGEWRRVEAAIAVRRYRHRMTVACHNRQRGGVGGVYVCATAGYKRTARTALSRRRMVVGEYRLQMA